MMQKYFKITILSMCVAASFSVQAAPKSSPSAHQAIYTQAVQAVQQQNHAKAFELLKPLAEKGDATAQNNIAVLYEEGLGVERNDAEALKWYTKAAQQGLADAQFMTAFFHASGRGTTQDYQQAFVWYQKAAKQGHADAQNNLAMRYATGMGVKRNIKLAKYWFKKAARAGNPSAAQALAELTQLEKNGTAQIISGCLNFINSL